VHCCHTSPVGIAAQWGLCQPHLVVMSHNELLIFRQDGSGSDLSCKWLCGCTKGPFDACIRSVVCGRLPVAFYASQAGLHQTWKRAMRRKRSDSLMRRNMRFLSGARHDEHVNMACCSMLAPANLVAPGTRAAASAHGKCTRAGGSPLVLQTCWTRRTRCGKREGCHHMHSSSPHSKLQCTVASAGPQPPHTRTRTHHALKQSRHWVCLQVKQRV
jgi:hypothetical protein